MKKVVVTGGAGFLGSHTCLVLLENGYEVIVIDSLINSSFDVINRLNIFKNKVDFIKGDLRDEIFLENFFYYHTSEDKKIHAVIHFAGLKSVAESVANPLMYWDFNLRGTINLLKMMDKYNCYKFVFSSSATIYGNDKINQLIKETDKVFPINPYGQTKNVIEQILKNLSLSENSKWKIASLRYFNPIGAHKSGMFGENLNNNPTNIVPILIKVAAGKLNEFKIFGNDWNTFDGTCIRDYIHVMDLADGHLAALNYLESNHSDNLEINLGTGLGTSVLQLIKTFSESNNLKIPYKFVSRRVGDSQYSVADISLAKSKLEWEPKRDLKMMCIDSWNWYIKNYSI